MSKEEEQKYNKYCNCKLYKIISKKTPDKIFYGITTNQLRKILSGKKTKYKQYIINNNVSYCPSFELIKNDDSEIILIDKFKCDDIDDYNKYLYDYINNKDHPNINSYLPDGYIKPTRKRLYYEKLYNTDTDKKEIDIIKKDIKDIKQNTENMSDIMNTFTQNINGGNMTKQLKYNNNDENNDKNDKNDKKNDKNDENGTKYIQLEYKKNNDMQFLTFDKPLNDIINNNNNDKIILNTDKNDKKNDKNDKNGTKYIQLNKSYKSVQDYNNNFFSNTNPILTDEKKNNFYENTEEYNNDIYNKDYYIINNKKYDIIDNKYINIDGVKIEKKNIDKYDLKKRKQEIKILELQIQKCKSFPDKTDNEYLSIDGKFDELKYKKDLKKCISDAKHQIAIYRYEND